MRQLAQSTTTLLHAKAAQLAWRYQRRQRRGRPQVWSIGIFGGPTPLALRPVAVGGRPAVQASDVTDLDAEFVADPFMIRVAGTWHLFFEVMERPTQRGLIAHATSVDGTAWQYDRKVLEEPFHLSYPYVFAHEGAVYMVPESKSTGQLRLYRATDFPHGWTFETVLIEAPIVDSSLFRWQGRWWLFAESGHNRKTALRLYGADALTGPWSEHPASPLRTGDLRESRPAGRVVMHDGKPLRLAQRVRPFYGMDVRAFVVEELTPTTYRERPASRRPVAGPGKLPWNHQGMHHVDAHQLDDGSWLAAADGWAWGRAAAQRPRAEARQRS